jgi:glycosyltransferase involved in cell wall biosynthesis
MRDPLVSAIIIFKDGQPFISEAIESILKQTYPQLELILADDGSVDGSTEIAEQFADRHAERVKVVHHPNHENLGMSATRNIGVKHSNGEFVAFLDADDVWLPHKILEQVQIMQSHPGIGLVYGKTQIWHNWTAQPGGDKDFFYDLGVEPNRIYEPPEMLANLVENKFQTPTTCNAMILKKAYDKLGGFEESFTGMYEDQIFFSKLYLNWPVYVSDSYWARYRQHAEKAKRNFSRVRYLKERRQFIRFVHKFAQSYWDELDDHTQEILTSELWSSRHPYLDSFAGRFKPHNSK